MHVVIALGRMKNLQLGALKQKGKLLDKSRLSQSNPSLHTLPGIYYFSTVTK